MLELVLATGNPHKVDELRAIFSALPDARKIRVLGLKDLPNHGRFTEPRETGTIFEQNAAIKAVSYAHQTGRLCLADDSGLEIDALQGRPGVISSHYSTDGRETGLSRPERDAANNARVLRELEGVPPEKRTARFVCVMALAEPPLSTTPSRGTGMLPVSTPPTSSVPQSLTIHERNLPHWQCGGSTYFVTFRTKTGELDHPERQIVLDACRHWHRRRAHVHLVCVMPDHVHLLITPTRCGEAAWHTLPDLMQSIKHFSARRINERREHEGRLWQDEYFDRVVRPDEAEDTWSYIVRNPVTAGLCREPWTYPYLWKSDPAPRPAIDEMARNAQEDVEKVAHGQHARATRLGRGIVATARGTFEGRIGLPPSVPRGHNGFGYDPLFLVAPDFARTGAELPSAEKNNLSHRAAAARQMAARLRDFTPRSPQ